MRLPVLLVDAFCDGPFTGNPAAVVTTAQTLSDSLMAQIAMEMNQAETAFVTSSSEGVYGLRWLTPTVEVDLCGHATLAAAHALWEDGAEGELRFETRSGILTATQDDDTVALDFPVEPPLAQAVPMFPKAVWTGRNRMDWFVQLDSERAVREFVPDLRAIANLGMRGLIVTAEAEATDFVSRCFFPQSGVNEDPVTGSAHCALAPFWAERLGKEAMTGEQASRRGGRVDVVLRSERVLLKGRAVTTLRGELRF